MRIPIDGGIRVMSTEAADDATRHKPMFVCALTNEMIEGLRAGSVVLFTVASSEYHICLTHVDHDIPPQKDEDFQ